MISFKAARRFTAMLFATIALGAVPGHAEYTGPTEGAEKQGTLRTVAEVLNHPQEDQIVWLTGVLMKKISKENYLFRDATGEIRVEIDAVDLPTEPINEKTRLEIVGEVDTGLMRAPRIDVHRVRLSNGTP
jgi:uncharacterized protein (TIGR00156 family)